MARGGIHNGEAPEDAVDYSYVSPSSPPLFDISQQSYVMLFVGRSLVKRCSFAELLKTMNSKWQPSLLCCGGGFIVVVGGTRRSVIVCIFVLCHYM